jgi:hypothetical protein
MTKSIHELTVETEESFGHDTKIYLDYVAE